MKRVAGIGVLAVALAASVQGLTVDNTIAAAEASAQAWLALLDAGNYSESWASAASHLRDTIPESQWVARLSTERGSLGAVTSRSLTSAEFEQSRAGAPEGQHVVIRFATSFEHKPDAVEIVMPLKDSDGRWRVDAYSIK
jgi:hypothetical protein